MKINIFNIIPEQELLHRIRHTPLVGFQHTKVYLNANIQITQININDVNPTQRYILKDNIKSIQQLYETLIFSHHIDIFKLNSAISYRIHGHDKSTYIIPPIIENTKDRKGNNVLVINDGMHRVTLAKQLQRTHINVILITNVPEQFPYYAYPLKYGWDDVILVDKLQPGFKKKYYVNEKDHKSLFRNFNAQFYNIQAKRKPLTITNPTTSNNK